VCAAWSWTVERLRALFSRSDRRATGFLAVVIVVESHTWGFDLKSQGSDMAIVYQVQAEDVAGLNQLQLTRLLKTLLILEARSAEISESAVDVGLKLEVPDGGEDGRISWTNGPDSTDFLPSNLVQFQAKAQDLGPKACADEIETTRGSIKPMIEDALSAGGSYALFTTQILNKSQKKKRIEKIREKLEELHRPYAKSASIHMFDASYIQNWSNKYASAITAILTWIGRPLIEGMKTWSSWERFDENQLFEFVPDVTRADALTELRRTLENPRHCSRIIGLSGLGKTRLALEICRGDTDTNALTERVVYIDASFHIPNLPGIVASWAQHGLDALIVVDNCDLKTHKQLRKEVMHPESVMSLLTLHYDPEVDAETNHVHIKQMSDDLIRTMLEPVYGEKIPDLERIVNFAQGFPQMAYLLARARLDQSRDMGSLTDDELVRKMLWGSDTADPPTEALLQACSLFDKFGREGSASEELAFIASTIARCDEDSLYKCVKKFEVRGVIGAAGRYCAIVPKPLAIRLASDWWRETRPETQLQLIQTQMPGQLETSFCYQVAKLDFLPEVKSLTASLCGELGPFGQAEVILSKRGSRLFRALVEVNPEATSRSIHKIVTAATQDEIRLIEGDVRRNLVWALEKLCFHAIAFDQSAEVLMRLAAAENESWSNNATGQFVQLFRVFLSGTEASPEQRLALIDRALNQQNSSIRQLAVEALESAIDTHGGTRTVGAEYQGSGQPLQEWRPKIWQEAFDYWIACLDRLERIALENSAESQIAKDAIGSHIRGLMYRGRDVVDRLDSIIRSIADSQGPFWPQAISSIKQSMQYDAAGLPEEAQYNLNRWLDVLSPKHLGDKLRLIVSVPSYEHEEEVDGSYIDIAHERAKALATEISPNVEEVSPHVQTLLEGEQRQTAAFGRELVITSKRWEPILSQSLDYLAHNPKANPSLLFGLLEGQYELDPDAWELSIERLARTAVLINHYPSAITTGQILPAHLDRVIELTRDGSLSADSVSILSYGRALDNVALEVVKLFTSNLSHISGAGAWNALDVLSMYCYQHTQRRAECKDLFGELLVSVPLNEKTGRRQLAAHHWKEAAEFVLSRSDEFYARRLMEHIVNSVSDEMNYSDLNYSVKPVVRILLSEFGKATWPVIGKAISAAEPLEEFRLSQLLSAEHAFERTEPSILKSLSHEILTQWCTEDPQVAPEFLAGTVETFVGGDEGYELSEHARFLLDNFGDNEKVLSSLSSNMSSFSWSGSVVPYYEKEIIALKALLQHDREAVRDWAIRRVDYLQQRIESEKITDAEESWGIR
jgi:hypothetical protein